MVRQRGINITNVDNIDDCNTGDEIREKAHDFLIQKGVKSMGETHTAFEIELWLTEFVKNLKQKI